VLWRGAVRVCSDVCARAACLDEEAVLQGAVAGTNRHIHCMASSSILSQEVGTAGGALCEVRVKDMFTCI